MSAGLIVADGLCTYFGGPYDPDTHTYRTPTFRVDNMNGPVFRRAAPNRDDHDTDYGDLEQPGTPIGCSVLVILEHGFEHRSAVAGATSGLKHVEWTVRMHGFLRSVSAYAEDVQDAGYALVDAIRARIETDRTCGTGGFEAGYGVGFQVAEGGEPWLRWELSPVFTSPKQLSKQYMMVEFTADQYIQA